MLRREKFSMLRKISAFVAILVLTIIFIIGCSETSQEILPNQLNLEDSLKQIIITKGANYNFLEDESYLHHMKTLAMEIVKNKDALPPHFAIGNLDDDNIPELAIFQERDPANLEDEGSLEIYKFNGEDYALLDKVSMNYDNTNYQMMIGKISETQNGLLLNNNVGAHAGITYGFILEDDKLVNILNDQKLSLISIYSNNEIKDIDKDGILEFSIYTIDPETEDSSVVNSDKMTLWYKWNGKDSADLVHVERKDYSKDSSDKDLFIEGEKLINENYNEFLNFFEANKDKLSKYDNTLLLEKYIEKLKDISFDQGVELHNIFISYQKDNNFDYLLEKYSLSYEQLLENLNSVEYLKRDRALKDEELLKEHLIQHINMGYRLASSEGMYYYVIDNQKFVDKFGDRIFNEYRDYLKVLALNTNEPSMSDGRLIISMERLAERILFAESFKMVYPYSDLLSEVNNIYDLYLSIYLYGDIHVATYDDQTFRIKEDALEEFHRVVEKYSHTGFASKINFFLELLEKNNYIVNDELKEKFIDWLN